MAKESTLTLTIKANDQGRPHKKHGQEIIVGITDACNASGQDFSL